MDLINLVVAFLCIIFVLMGYNSMKTSGVKCYNLSFFFFFFCFLLNTTKLSIYQQDNFYAAQADYECRSYVVWHKHY